MEWKCFYHEKAMIGYWRECFTGNEKDLPNGITLETLSKAEKEVVRTEKKFREAAKRFFDGDASDLIKVDDNESCLDFQAEI
jgi:hypothetical protein